MFFRRRHPIRDEELNAYVDGELDVAARGRLETHLESCAACREAISELRAVRQALRELPRAAAPRSFALREADVQPETPRPFGLVGRAQPLLGGVAAVAVVAFLVLVGLDVADRPGEQSDSIAAGESAPGAMESLELDTFANASETQPEEAVEYDAEPDDDEVALDGGLEESAPHPATRLAPEAAPPPEAPDDAGMQVKAEDDSRTGLRVAEAALAAVALVAGGSVALIWWRRRSTPAA